MAVVDGIHAVLIHVELMFILSCWLLTSGGQVSSVSWEHFFMSMNQYYVSLRQEAPMAADVSSHATYRHHMRSITPQEVEGLSAVLKLIRTIIEQVNSGE